MKLFPSSYFFRCICISFSNHSC